MPSADDIVENKADNHPEHDVKGGPKRYGGAPEDDCKIDVLEETYFEPLVQYPLEQWCKNAGKKEEDEAIVELTVREYTSRPNHTPLQRNVFEPPNARST